MSCFFPKFQVLGCHCNIEETLVSLPEAELRVGSVPVTPPVNSTEIWMKRLLLIASLQLSTGDQNLTSEPLTHQ